MPIASIEAGASHMQYRPQLTGCPALAHIDVPTTFADAPIGVAHPPTSVPMDRVHAKVCMLTPVVAANDSMIGIIVAVNGMLSTKALAMPDTHITMPIIR